MKNTLRRIRQRRRGMHWKMTNNEIKKLCRSLGADLVGIASVDRFVNAPKGHHPTDVMPTAKSVISLGTVLPKETLGQDIRTYTDIKYNYE